MRAGEATAGLHDEVVVLVEVLRAARHGPSTDEEAEKDHKNGQQLNDLEPCPRIGPSPHLRL